jgi:hypothetical protein
MNGTQRKAYAFALQLMASDYVALGVFRASYKCVHTRL